MNLITLDLFSSGKRAFRRGVFREGTSLFVTGAVIVSKHAMLENRRQTC